MKRGVATIVVVLSILLVGLYTVTSTYSIIIDVIENNGVNEIVNDITVRDLLINEDGTYNQTYYDVKSELSLTDNETDILMNSIPINDALQKVLESIVEYKVNNNADAKMSNEEIYNLISSSVLNTENISDEVKSRIINKASIYRNDIKDFIYDIEVSVLGDTI